MANNYKFGEKSKEYNAKTGQEVEVWQSPRYIEAKKAAIKMLESATYKDTLTEGDFWILMNMTKSGKMAYTGLIISHNGCLKINDCLPYEKQFKPESMTLDKDGYGNSLVYSYCNSEQGIYEVGEVSAKNCSNAYPYAMALKRCMDRVILKNSKLAYAGVYSDSEAEEFKNDSEGMDEKKKEAAPKAAPAPAPAPARKRSAIREDFVLFCKTNSIDIIKVCKEYHLNDGSPDEDFKKALDFCNFMVDTNTLGDYLKIEEV